MPRASATKTTNNGNEADNKPQIPQASSTIKSEMPSPVEAQQVFHRKSERRKVARDIFLVFEEHPSNRRSRGAKRSNRCGRIKPKFGHLKVEHPATCKRKTTATATSTVPATTTSTLLRDIKNETKSFNHQAANSGKTTTHAKDITKKVKPPKVTATPATPPPASTATQSGATATALPVLKSPSTTPTSTSTTKQPTENEFKSTEQQLEPAIGRAEVAEGVARVNPIFLWVKQDDTRIVEVKCEDYDKRNRIRIKKTTNGWQAIPRTDPSTSKVVKYFQTPFVKVKREAVQHSCSSSSPDTAGLGVTHADADTRDSTRSHSTPAASSGEDKCRPTLTVNVNNNVADPLAQCWSYGPVTQLKKDISEKGNDDMDQTAAAEDAGHAHDMDGLKFNASYAGLAMEGANVQPPHEARSPLKEPPAEAEPLSCDHDDTTNGTYQTASTPEMQLCPKTGFFLPNSCVDRPERGPDDESGLGHQADAPNADLEATKQLQQAMDEDLITRLDAESRNLKDLLEDADLMQHCSENLIGGSELIDSLVKRSCENNLIQDTDVLKDTVTTMKASFEVLPTSVTEMTPASLLLPPAAVAPVPLSASPKGLSFNEAGEIESINGEQLFHLDTTSAFAKDPHDDLTTSATTTPTTTRPTPLPASNQQPSLSADTELNTSLASPPPHSTHSSIITVMDGSEQSPTPDGPKDLSYKKREEVCPPPESRSQCAVTSSSDIVKSPAPDDDELPTIETTSEAIKNLILEQFIKLSALNKMPTASAVTGGGGGGGGGGVAGGLKATTTTTTGSAQLLEPIDLGIPHRRSTAASESGDSSSSFVVPTTNFIETVVIDDNSNDHHDEPAKKRPRTLEHPTSSPTSCSTTTTTLNNNNNSGSASKNPTNVSVGEHQVPSVLDKDPDPLTQLQLLLRNAEWKVPDPILVPKERLSAVLASPAREIPLLITTRPELRLPEAFAYPEIIQNPNILVISMAQLEAILRNEHDQAESGKRKTPRMLDLHHHHQQQQHQQQQQQRQMAAVPGGGGEKRASNANVPNAAIHNRHTGDDPTTDLTVHTNSNNIHDSNNGSGSGGGSSGSGNSSGSVVVVGGGSGKGVKGAKVANEMQPNDLNTKCSHIESSSSKLASDINAATLAVLNQMLWLPYIGELAQKTTTTAPAAKTLPLPIIPNTNNQLPQPQQQQPQPEWRQLDELYKNYMKELSAPPEPPAKTAPPSLSTFQQQMLHNFANPASNALGAAMRTFQNPLEIAIYHKLLQYQMHQMLSSSMGVDELAGTAAPSVLLPKVPARSAHEPEHHTTQTTAQMKPKLGNAASQALEKAAHNLGVRDMRNLFENRGDPEQRQHQEQPQQQQHPQQSGDSKPRLTCKSLSNLLEPETVQSPSAAALLSGFAGLDANGQGQLMSDVVKPDIVKIAEKHFAMAGQSEGKLHGSAKMLNPFAALSAYNEGATKSRQRHSSYHYDGNGLAAASTVPTNVMGSAATPLDASSAGPTDSNAALWHPLFGSNPKAAGYSSPWQWTTVTATGE